MLKRPEILAPAGDMDALRGAVRAGADAVYAGGDRFGARAYARNFHTDEMIEAIHYVHRHGCRLYLTLNTLVKEKEFGQLYEYMSPFYEAGLDGVIIQDMGVGRYLKKQFPLLPLHGSTQMSITGVRGARLLKEFGASRIVPARELSLEEIRQIREQVDIEVETFVHGAVCYCYSGQCLMSSMLGGRSGNRGRCAQPCRLPYTLFRGEQQISKRNRPYLLSPGDMCTIELLPELVQAGIDSFKIEGRMKGPVYVAAVVSLYRKYLEEYLEHPEKEFSVSRQDMTALMDTFNRGGFSRGYYHIHNGKELMSEQNTGHQGVLVGTVNSVQNNGIRLLLTETIHKGDRLDIITGRELPVSVTVPEDRSEGTSAFLKAHHIRQLRKGQKVYRIANAALTGRITERYLDCQDRIPIQMEGYFSIGAPAVLVVKQGNRRIQVEGRQVEKALTLPVTEKQIREQLSKTGNTGYQVTSCTLEVEPQAFLPVQAVKELRRQGLARLEETIRAEFRRKPVSECGCRNKYKTETDAGKPELSVSLYRSCYLPLVLGRQEIVRINIDYSLFSMEEWKKILEQAHTEEQKVYCIFPRVLRHNTIQWIRQQKAAFMELGVDGIIVSSMDAYAYVRDELDWKSELVCDYSLYQYNRSAVDFFQAPSVLPVELNQQELCQLEHPCSEMILYGYLPVMISAGCCKKNSEGCDHREEILWLQDRYQKKFPVLNRCNYCYNVIYNSEPVYYLDMIRELKIPGCRGYQLHFTVEALEQAEHMIEEAIGVCCYGRQAGYRPERFTRGHWKRGIE